WAQGEKLAGFLIVVVTCAAAAFIAAWLVRRFSPHASGSGIPHVEAVLNGEIRQAPFHLIWVKFCGGEVVDGARGGVVGGRARGGWRGPERADGGEHWPPFRKHLPPRVARLQGAACGRCGCRPCHRVQRTDGGRGFRSGGACASVRAPYRSRGARCVGRSHRG